MSTVPVFLAIAAVHFLAIASPGPTLMVVTSHVVSHGRRVGFMSIVGVMIATLFWSSTAALGLGGVIAQLGWLYVAMKAAGALYLAWMGAKLILSAVRGGSVTVTADRPTATGLQAIRAGFVTNISNPKVVAYYASLFGVMIPAGAPHAMFAGAVATAVIVSGVWWIAVVLFFGLKPIRDGYARARRWINAAMGTILIGLAGRLVAR
ncbi:MAG: LysE family transporter [Rhodobiaceae bacterium]|nr:LysE family transporter [Rhodobiaceae bacterium]